MRTGLAGNLSVKQNYDRGIYKDLGIIHNFVILYFTQFFILHFTQKFIHFP